MKTSLGEASTRELFARLAQANAAFAKQYPGEPAGRQPVHTVYGGAHLFKADSAAKLGALAQRVLEEHAPSFDVLARALGLPGADELPDTPEGVEALKAQLEGGPEATRRAGRPAFVAHTVYSRVVEKLRREPVEDFRIDFEDGYGHRPSREEDEHAARAAAEVARGMAAGSLPPFLGIRVKPLNEELRDRSARTLDIFLSSLCEATGGKLPPGFVVTLPKVTTAAQVDALVELFEVFESELGLARGALKMELMIEAPQALFDARGEVVLPKLVVAAGGRCVAAHLGAYDYTASLGVTAAHQALSHPACDFARHMMQVSLAGTGVWLSDGATNLLPIGPHRSDPKGPPLTESQVRENRAAVHRAWKLHYDHIERALAGAFYQGWDLHPAQLPARYAALYAFFLDGLDAAAERLRGFVAKAAQATLAGSVFDDAATGQGLLNYFRRAIACGAITDDEASAHTGLSVGEIRGRSFLAIVESRQRAPGA